jgi:hypothetical protein
MTLQHADKYEAAVDQAIATCGGDIRGALKALIIANEFLEAELYGSAADPDREMHYAEAS